MLRSFVTWLDDHLADAGAAGLIQGAVGILGFGALLGVVLGNESIKAATIVAVSLVALGMFLLLAASRLYWRRRCEAVEDLFRRACLEVLSAGPYWQVVTWRQRMTIEDNGDTRLFIAIRVASDRDALPFFRLKLGPGWNQPRRYRDKVVAKARVTVDRLPDDFCVTAGPPMAVPFIPPHMKANPHTKKPSMPRP